MTSACIDSPLIWQSGLHAHADTKNPGRKNYARNSFFTNILSSRNASLHGSAVRARARTPFGRQISNSLSGKA
jgi:hypothetical protein